jgi:hypothetical protein
MLLVQNVKPVENNNALNNVENDNQNLLIFRASDMLVFEVTKNLKGFISLTL